MRYPHCIKHGFRSLPPRRVILRRAVSMIELVIVIMVMGILAAVAAPAFYDSLVHHRVESAAHRVKADLELARQTARLKSTTQTITFTNSAYLFGNSVRGLDDPSESYTVDLADAPYGLSYATANFANTQTVAFDGYGTPTSGGTVVLAIKGHQCIVTLDGVSGEVSISSVHVRGNLPPVDAN